MYTINANPERLQKAVKELYYWRQDVHATNFTSQLYRLIAKADGSNRAKIARGFPEEAAAYTMWEQAETEEKFFRMYDLKL